MKQSEYVPTARDQKVARLTICRGLAQNFAACPGIDLWALSPESQRVIANVLSEEAGRLEADLATNK